MICDATLLRKGQTIPSEALPLHYPSPAFLRSESLASARSQMGQ
jgi:hypothetical protein